MQLNDFHWVFSANVCLITHKGHFSSHDYVTLRTYFWAKTKSPKLFCSARNACVTISSFSHIHLSNLLLWELEKRVGFPRYLTKTITTGSVMKVWYCGFTCAPLILNQYPMAKNTRLPFNARKFKRLPSQNCGMISALFSSRESEK